MWRGSPETVRLFRSHPPHERRLASGPLLTAWHRVHAGTRPYPPERRSAWRPTLTAGSMPCGTPTTSLRALAGPLTAEQLQQRSYDSEWSIAQVLSHLGSQAEVFDLWLDAGLTGQEPPGREAFGPIWEAWNARSPQAQASRLAAGQRGAGRAARVARRRPAGAVPPADVRDGPRHRRAGADAPVRARDPQLGRGRGAGPVGDGWRPKRSACSSTRSASSRRGPASRMGTSGGCTCRRATRSGTSRWRPARRSRSNPAAAGEAPRRPGAAAARRGSRPAGLRASRSRPHPARRDPGGRSRRAPADLPRLLRPWPANERTPRASSCQGA